MTFIRRILGLIIVLTGLFGVALSVGVVLYGNEAIDAGVVQAVSSLDLLDGNLATTEEVLLSLQGTLAETQLTLDTISKTAANGAESINDTIPLIDGIGDIATEQVPSSLDAVQATIPNIAEVAGTIDRTLFTLSQFGFEQNFFGLGTIDFDLGIDYNPEASFQSSIEDLGSSLEGIPDQLRSLDEEISATTANLETISGDVEQLAVNLEGINEEVGSFSPLIGEYVVTINQISDQLAGGKSQLEANGALAKQGIMVLAIWFGLVQLAPLAVGFGLLFAPRQRRRESPATYLQNNLAMLPDQLRELHTNLENSTSFLNTMSGNVGQLAENLSVVTKTLSETPDLLDEYVAQGIDEGEAGS